MKEEGGARSIHRIDEKFRRDHFEDTGIHRQIILK
jgi:hypothetical protein